jgi:adenosylmethionine-8-amino-7-oxononanoate aminotransferase
MKQIHKSVYDAGVMVRLGGNNILMSPPLIITEGEVDRVLGALDAGLGSV